jgi:hypothetical protein
MKKGSNHMKIMAICCGLPLIGFMLIGVLGVRAPSLETILFLACPIGMGYMMLTMHRKDGNEGKSCHQSEEEKQEIPENLSKLQENEPG